ncbi:MAG: DMT family transporter [Bacteroidota bacterium]
MSPKPKAHIALFTVALIYGANYTVAKEVMNNGYIQPVGFILIRVTAALFFFQVFQRLFIREKIARQDLLRFFLCGLFGVAINQICFFSGLKYTTPINASLIMTTTPILVLLSSAILIGEKITFQKILGILIGATGAIMLISFGQKVDFQREQLFGDLLILINACSYGIYIVLAKTLMDKYQPLTVVSWIFFFGWLFIIPLGFKEASMVEWGSFPLHIWLAVAFVILLATVVTYLLNAFALSIVNPSTVSIYIYLQPLLASAIALAFAKDKLEPEKVLAGAMIFVGVYLVSQSSVKKAVAKKG